MHRLTMTCPAPAAAAHFMDHDGSHPLMHDDVPAGAGAGAEPEAAGR